MNRNLRVTCHNHFLSKLNGVGQEKEVIQDRILAEKHFVSLECLDSSKSKI